MIKSIISRFTMVKETQLFVDRVNGKPVYRYRDYYFQLWMAQSKWGFRTRMNA